MLRPLLCWLSLSVCLAFADPARPNIVLILVDDLGTGDVGCFGAKDIRTPHLDALAKQGTRFTDFYVAQAVCTASRAALLTGCYPNRVGMQGALNHTSRFGLNPSEWTLPKMLKDRGYATACFGKWHLGTVPELSAPRQGFDEFFGLPYSNDNSKYHPTLAPEMPPLPLLDGEKVAELDPDQSAFTTRFTARSVDFIERNKDRPFFLYLPHVMPHVPIFASDKFKGRSARGLYGDVVEEIDDNVGKLMQQLKSLGIDFVVRLHQCRTANFRRGRRLGRERHSGSIAAGSMPGGPLLCGAAAEKHWTRILSSGVAARATIPGRTQQCRRSGDVALPDGRVHRIGAGGVVSISSTRPSARSPGACT